jgi:hypothetical protein
MPLYCLLILALNEKTVPLEKMTWGGWEVRCPLKSVLLRYQQWSPVVLPSFLQRFGVIMDLGPPGPSPRGGASLFVSSLLLLRPLLRSVAQLGAWEPLKGCFRI